MNTMSAVNTADPMGTVNETDKPKLPSLKICVEVPAAPAPPTLPGAGLPAEGMETLCRFCGLRAGLHAMRIGAETACVLCGLVESLHRPTIDEEVRLIWLPEMSQAVLNVLVRQIHIDLRDLEESVYCEDVPNTPEGMRPVLYNAQRILLERRAGILDRLGSSRAGDLAEALATLGRRHAKVEDLPLGGLRVFPAGRFYIGGVNVYDEIVDSWRGQPGDGQPGAGPPEEDKSAGPRAKMSEAARAELMAGVA